MYGWQVVFKKISNTNENVGHSTEQGIRGGTPEKLLKHADAI